MSLLGESALGQLPLADTHRRANAAATVPSVFATAEVGEVEAFDGGVFAYVPDVSAETQVGLLKVNLGVGAWVPAVASQGLVGAVDALGQYAVDADVAGVFAQGLAGKVRVDAEFRSVSVPVPGVAVGARVGNMDASGTAWEPDVEPYPAEWDEDTTLC